MGWSKDVRDGALAPFAQCVADGVHAVCYFSTQKPVLDDLVSEGFMKREYILGNSWIYTLVKEVPYKDGTLKPTTKGWWEMGKK